MALSLKHAFNSLKGDGTDPTQVQPSNWNAEHTITVGANTLLGAVGAGAVSEIPCTTLGRSILASATITDLIAAGVPIFSTGDIKLTLKTVADTGWIMCTDGTIGNTASGATYAVADALTLYTLLWNNVSDTYAPVTTGRGGSAAADWAAQKKIALTKMLGRALSIAGSGSGLTARTLGQTLGEENHTITTAEMPVHTHSVTDPGHLHADNANPFKTGNFAIGAGGPPGTQATNSGTQLSWNTATATTGITIQNAGTGNAANVMQPTSFLNVMIKL